MALVHEAMEEIKEMIVTGELEPGEKLPTENDLAARLGLSRGSLREAVRTLTFLGILDTRQGSGTYVTSLDAALLLNGLGFVVDILHSREVLDLLEIRRLLEPAATALAVTRLTGDELARLKDCMRRMDETSDVEELVAADTEFHDIIVGASGNEALASLVRSISSRTIRARTWRGITEQDALERTRIAHRNIYGALVERDPELARAASAMHITEVEFSLRRMLSEEDSKAGRPPKETCAGRSTRPAPSGS